MIDLQNQQEVNQFSNSIIDQTLAVLRDQKDDTQNVVSNGHTDISPHVFTSVKIYVTGPFEFQSPFDSQPEISFGQIVSMSGSTAIETMSNTPPFLVMPFVRAWKFTSGKVDGFWLGAYALTPPTSSTLTVSWHAQGKASRYVEQQSQEMWTEAYDQNEADYLVDDIDVEDYTFEGEEY